MRIIVFTCLFFLFGCSAEDLEAPQTPENVSLGFFNAIYVERDVNKAKQFVDKPLKQVLTHYYIASAVQRHVLNLAMTQVKVEIEEIDIDFFRKFTDDVTVTVKMKGLKGGRDWVDDRTIRLHKNNNGWLIVEILPEKGNINN